MSRHTSVIRRRTGTAKAAAAADKIIKAGKKPAANGPAAWWKEMGVGYANGRWKYREKIDASMAELVAFLKAHPGWGLAAWAAAVLKCQRTSIRRAIREKRVEVAKFRLPSGHVVQVVNLEQAQRVGRGW